MTGELGGNFSKRLGKREKYSPVIPVNKDEAQTNLYDLIHPQRKLTMKHLRRYNLQGVDTGLMRKGLHIK